MYNQAAPPLQAPAPAVAIPPPAELQEGTQEEEPSYLSQLWAMGPTLPTWETTEPPPIPRSRTPEMPALPPIEDQSMLTAWMSGDTLGCAGERDKRIPDINKRRSERESREAGNRAVPGRRTDMHSSDETFSCM